LEIGGFSIKNGKSFLGCDFGWQIQVNPKSPIQNDMGYRAKFLDKKKVLRDNEGNL